MAIPMNLFLVAVLSITNIQSLNNQITAQSQAIAVLEVANGIVVERQGRKIISQSGDRLYWGDLISVRRGGRATIRCLSNGQDWIIPDDGTPRGVSNYCS